MNPGQPSSTPTKRKFRPKPLRRSPIPTPTEIDTDAQDNADDGETKEGLSRRLQGLLARRTTKVEKKSTATAEVTFGLGASSTGLRTFGIPTEKTYNGSGAASPHDFTDDGQNLVTSAPIDGMEVDEDSKGSSDDEAYQEPWNYNSYYPTTLPLRKPYSGDPEVLDKVEFEEAAGAEDDESTINSASELGLLANSKGEDANRMLLFQFPDNLPFIRSSTSGSKEQKDAKGKERDGGEVPSNKGHSLKELPEGCIGKMLVYKNGDVKMKLGDILYDVSPGTVCTSDQTVVAVNTKERHCVALGKLDKGAVVTPDLDSLLERKLKQ